MSSKKLASLLASTTVLAMNSSSLIALQPCLKTAWAFQEGHCYDAAIQAAEQCIQGFARAAKQKEEELRNVPLIPPGPLPPADRVRAVGQGILNDVAAACIVKGEAAEALAQSYSKNVLLHEGFTKIAIEAYETALVFRHALVSDGKTPETFWSPCLAASDHLQVLTGQDRSKVCQRSRHPTK